MSGNIIDQIKHDHLEIQTFYDNYKNAIDAEEAKKWFHQFVWELSRHSVGEELVLYPLMAALNQKGQDLADEGRKDHHKVKELLSEISKESDPVVFDQKIDAIMSDLKTHIQKEESEDLVFLSDNVTPQNLDKAGKAFSMKKKIAPTRPHPGVPEKPIALEGALGLLIAPVDKFRDLFTSFPDDV